VKSNLTNSNTHGDITINQLIKGNIEKVDLIDRYNKALKILSRRYIKIRGSYKTVTLIIVVI
jgi:hypothetical protein